MHKTSFLPISQTNAAVLILGSFPGQKSLDEQAYYAHPRNSFWPIMNKLFNIPLSPDFNIRYQSLREQRIALWDTLRRCEREGSLDSAIDTKSAEANNFTRFFDEHPSLDWIFFNGGTSAKLFKKYVDRNLLKQHDITAKQLPSTSPAHARMTFEEKLSAWRLVSQALKSPS